jgi:hypothetical protein
VEKMQAGPSIHVDGKDSEIQGQLSPDPGVHSPTKKDPVVSVVEMYDELYKVQVRCLSLCKSPCTSRFHVAQNYGLHQIAHYIFVENFFMLLRVKKFGVSIQELRHPFTLKDGITHL